MVFASGGQRINVCAATADAPLALDGLVLRNAQFLEMMIPARSGERN